VTIGGLTDRFGERQAAAVRLRVETLPLGASATIAEGLLLLDPEAARSFPVHSRNLTQAELDLWPYPTTISMRSAARSMPPAAVRSPPDPRPSTSL